MTDDAESDFDAALRRRLAAARRERLRASEPGESHWMGAAGEPNSYRGADAPRSPRTPLQFTLSAALYSLFLIAAFLAGFRWASEDLRGLRMQSIHLHAITRDMQSRIGYRLDQQSQIQQLQGQTEELRARLAAIEESRRLGR